VFNLDPATQCHHLDAFLWQMQVASCTSLQMVQAQLLAVAAMQPQLRRQPLQLRLALRPAPPILLPQKAMAGYIYRQRQRCGRSSLHRQPRHRADRPVRQISPADSHCCLSASPEGSTDLWSASMTLKCRLASPGLLFCSCLTLPLYLWQIWIWLRCSRRFSEAAMGGLDNAAVAASCFRSMTSSTRM